ncbi:MAG: protein kinase [Bryobacteraceae bacterium]
MIPEAISHDEATVVAGPATQQGTILGTVAYMSPEQAEGKRIDGLSDLFSLGAVLYEMATGRRAFSGSSTLSTLSAILRDEPTPLHKIAPQLPRALEEVIARCLRKQPAERFPSAMALAQALEGIRPAGTGRARWQVYAAVAATMILVMVGVWFSLAKRPADGPPRVKMIRLTTLAGAEMLPQFSPDGAQFSFLTYEDTGEAVLHVQDRATGREITKYNLGLGFPRSLRWSSDGKQVAYLRNKWILRRTLEKLGSEERIMEIAEARAPSLDWSRDGSLLAYTDKTGSSGQSIFLLSIATRERRMLTSIGSWNDSDPVFSPSGKQVAFVRMFDNVRFSVFVTGLRGEDPRQIGGAFLSISSLAWSPDEEWVYLAGRQEGNRGVWRVSVQADAKSVPQLVANGSLSSLSIARPSPLRILASEQQFRQEILRAALQADGKVGHAEEVREAASTASETYPAYSPDGTQIAFVSDRNGSAQVWVTEAAGARRVTNLGRRAAAPRWSPDGKRLVCSVLENAGRWIYVVELDGSSRKLVEGARPSWSGDGQWIYFMQHVGGRSEVFKIPAVGGEKVQITQNGGFELLESPDKRGWFCLKSNLAAELVRLLPDGKEEPIAQGVSEGAWTVSKDFVWYFTKEGRLMTYSLAGGHVQERGSAQRRGQGLSVSPDQRWVLTSGGTQRPEADIVLLEEQ